MICMKLPERHTQSRENLCSLRLYWKKTLYNCCILSMLQRLCGRHVVASPKQTSTGAILWAVVREQIGNEERGMGWKMRMFIVSICFDKWMGLVDRLQMNFCVLCQLCGFMLWFYQQLKMLITYSAVCFE